MVGLPTSVEQFETRFLQRARRAFVCARGFCGALGASWAGGECQKSKIYPQDNHLASVSEKGKLRAGVFKDVVWARDAESRLRWNSRRIPDVEVWRGVIQKINFSTYEKNFSKNDVWALEWVG